MSEILTAAEFERLTASLAFRFVSPQADAEIQCIVISHRALAERLGEAEGERDKIRATLATMMNQADAEEGRTEGSLAAYREMLHETEAQLARERADHAATVAELLHFANNDGRLGAYLNTVIDDLQIDGKGQYFRDLFGEFSKEMAALAATPATGAAAVLAADQDDHLSKAYLQLVRLIERADNVADQQGDDDFVYFYNMPCGPWHKVIGAIRKTIADNAMDYDQEAARG